MSEVTVTAEAHFCLMKKCLTHIPHRAVPHHVRYIAEGIFTPLTLKVQTSTVRHGLTFNIPVINHTTFSFEIQPVVPLLP